MKTLDRELARAKVTANRVAVVVANEWKDANDKVMPVRQWLEERRFMQVCNFCLELYGFSDFTILQDYHSHMNNLEKLDYQKSFNITWNILTRENLFWKCSTV